jgi:hypothetical protein
MEWQGYKGAYDIGSSGKEICILWLTLQVTASVSHIQCNMKSADYEKERVREENRSQLKHLCIWFLSTHKPTNRSHTVVCLPKGETIEDKYAAATRSVT